MLNDVIIIGREINDDAIAVAEAAGHRRVKCDVLNAPAHMPVEGYIASPPCQTFSTAGKGEGRAAIDFLLEAAHHVADGMHPLDAIKAVGSPELDERSVLVLHPLRVIRESSPGWVTMEQVPNAQPVFALIARILEERFGYVARAEVLHAEEYGVPQTRKRTILVAVKRELLGDRPLPWPEKTHSRYHVKSPDSIDEGYARWVSMAEALTWGMTQRPYPAVAAGTEAGGTDPQCIGGSGARRTIAREREEGRWVEKDHDDSPETYARIFRPAPGWVRVTHTGDVVRANGTVREVGQPAPTITGSLDNGNFRWVPEFNDQSGTPYDELWPFKRPATAVAGRGLVQNPGATANRHNGSTKSRNDGVRVSVAEAGILQSFRPDYPWGACKTKSSQYQRAGDAIPPLLAAAVFLPLLLLGIPVARILEDFAGPGGWDEGMRLALEALSITLAEEAAA